VERLNWRACQLAVLNQHGTYEGPDLLCEAAVGQLYSRVGEEFARGIVISEPLKYDAGTSHSGWSLADEEFAEDEFSGLANRFPADGSVKRGYAAWLRRAGRTVRKWAGTTP
jgi:hypothetical protein